MKSYRFYIETNDGEHTEWLRLTRLQAMGMYRNTAASTPDNVKRFGWEEVK